MAAFQDRQRPVIGLEESLSDGSSTVNSFSLSNTAPLVPSPPQKSIERRRPHSARTWSTSSGGSRSSGQSGGGSSLRSCGSFGTAASLEISGRSYSKVPQGVVQHGSLSRRQPAEQEFRALCEIIGRKAALRFKTITKCFFHMDKAHHGKLDRHQLRHVFRTTFNLSHEYADRFLAFMDPNGVGQMDYKDLRRIVANHISPGYQPSQARPERVPMPRDLSTELRHIASMIAVKAHQKHRNGQEIFRFIDEDRDGLVHREECVRFVESFGFPRPVGNRVFDQLANLSRNGNMVSIDVFMDTFAPLVVPGYRPVNDYSLLEYADSFGPDVSGSARPRPASARVNRPSSAGHRPSSARGGPVGSARAVASWRSSMNSSDGDPGFLRSATPQESPAGTTNGLDGLLRSPERLLMGDLLANSFQHDNLYGRGLAEGRYRSEVFRGPRGDVTYVPAPPKWRVENRTWNSNQMAERLGSRKRSRSEPGFGGSGATSRFWHGPPIEMERYDPQSTSHDYNNISPKAPTTPKPNATRRPGHRPVAAVLAREKAREAPADEAFGTVGSIPFAFEHPEIDSGHLHKTSDLAGFGPLRTRTRPLSAGPTMAFSRDTQQRGRSGRQPGTSFKDHAGNHMYEICPGPSVGDSVAQAIIHPTFPQDIASGRFHP
eukprot:TRINITY_DN13507_c0_g1_i1.p1 TRINITY_DN13507_c0_g1~~TRINITY_DN13507_c0_g1_i1.p1  ORF type:complete len:692 (+),score=85.83 TRINITY_DN13507_c0_g1_i1:101-2077(+)